MLHVIVLTILLICLVAASLLLGSTYWLGAPWMFASRAVYYCFASTVLALLVYVHCSRPVSCRRPILWKLSFAAFFFSALPIVLPVGFIVGVCLAVTGVLGTDEPGSHADPEILGTIGMMMLGLMCGPIVGALGIVSARKRIRNADRTLVSGDRTIRALD